VESAVKQEPRKKKRKKKAILENQKSEKKS
jgi:hypothetical protein